jgi:hypothetical protein
LQLVSGVGDTPSAVVVSTLMEAWGVVQGGLVADGTVTDVSPEACETVPILTCLLAFVWPSSWIEQVGRFVCSAC